MRIPTLMPALYRINAPASTPTIITKSIIPLGTIPEWSVEVDVDVVIVPNVVIDLDIVSQVHIVASHYARQRHCTADARPPLSRSINTGNVRIYGAIGLC